LDSNTNNNSTTNTLNAEIEESRITLIGRIFTLGGSALFLIGSLIAVIVSFKTFKRLTNTTA